MKLFVWDEPYIGSLESVGFALAETESEARELIRARITFKFAQGPNATFKYAPPVVNIDRPADRVHESPGGEVHGMMDLDIGQR